MITVDRKALARALKIVAPAVAKTSHLAALFGVRLLTTDEGLTLTASNLDLTIGTVLGAKGDDLDVVVSASTLGRIIGAGRGPEVHIESEDAKLVISAGVSASMPTIPHPFPNVTTMADDATGASLSAEDMENIWRVLHAVSVDPQRIRLAAVHLAGFHAEATDSYRLARTTLSVEVPDILVQPDVVRAVVENASAPVGVRSDGKRVEFTSGPTTWLAQMVPQDDEAFPDLSRLLDSIRAKHHAELTVSAPDLVDMLDRLKSLGAVTAKSPAELNAEGSTLVASRDIADVGALGDDIPAEGTLATLRVHPGYLSEAIEHARCDEVTIHSGDTGRPVLVESEGYVAVVMPVAGSAK